MAVYGVLGDIHGNREALLAALDALEANGVRRIVCLGDVVGYNADPDECVALVRSRCALTIAGNHDLIGLGRLDFRRCSNKAEYSLRRTRRALAPASRQWLASLPARHELERGVVLVHGGVRDVQQYMVTPGIIRENAALLREDFPGARVCFFGHSHEQKIYAVDGDEVGEVAAHGVVQLDRQSLCFVNPGSVDASRKRGDKLAECAILDTSAWTVEFLRVRYDAAATEVKAAAFGYRISPLIDRLYSLQRRLARLPRKLGAAG
jgi:predicted phosphodiesterase